MALSADQIKKLRGLATTRQQHNIAAAQLLLDALAATLPERRQVLCFAPRAPGDRVELPGVDLRHAVFDGYGLREADLTGALLAGASLREAGCRAARFTRANLRGADLTRADLTWTDLGDADLTGACLVGARLAQARLDGADLTGADLSGADLRRTTLTRATLEGARWDAATRWPAGWEGPRPPRPTSQELGRARLAAVMARAGPDAIVVDAQGGGAHTSLGDAIQHARAGATIVLAPGRYVGAHRVSETFLTILGAGADLVEIGSPHDAPLTLDGGTLVLTGVTLRALGPGAPALNVLRGQAQLDDVALTAAHGHGVSATPPNDVEARVSLGRALVHDCDSRGVLVEGAKASLKMVDCVLVDSAIGVEVDRGARLDMSRVVVDGGGFGVRVLGGARAIVEGGRIAGCSVVGVQCNVSDLELRAAVIADSGRDGLRLDGQGRVTIDGLVVAGSANNAISVSRCAPTMRRVRVLGASGGGLCFFKGAGGRVEGATVARASFTGVFIEEPAALELFDVEVVDCGSTGVYVHSGAPHLERSRVARCGRMGLEVGAKARPTIRDMLVRQAGTWGVVVRSGSACRFERLAVLAAREGGVVDEGGTTTFKDLLVRDVQGRGLVLDKGGSCSVDTALVCGVADGGVLVLSGAAPRLTRVVAVDNREFDFHANSGASPTAVDCRFGGASTAAEAELVADVTAALDRALARVPGGPRAS